MNWATLGHIGLLVLLDLALVGGLIAIPLGLSGTFIILGLAVLVGALGSFHTIPLWVLVIMAVLVVGAEVVESLLGSVMAKRFGATRWGMAGAFLGGLLGGAAGTAVLPVIGSIVGSFLSSALLAVFLEWWRARRLRESLPAGWGALLGKALSTSMKMAIGFAMAIYIVVRTH